MDLDAQRTGTTRGRRARIADAVLTRLLGLPAATSDYTVTRGLRVPMRDGVELVADHYAPAGRAAGTVLIRGPYGRGTVFAAMFARPYAARGYHVLFQSVRGTFGSGGTFEPMANEADDGADTVTWLREQPWFGGRFATIGLSYLGWTQWALLADPPPELATAVILVGPHDMYEAVHGTGAFTLTDYLGWSELVANQEKYAPVRELVRTLTAQRRVAPAVRGLPLVEAGERFLAGGAPWYRDWVSRRDRTDPFWARLQLAGAIDRVAVPVQLIGGWQDLFLRQTLAQYDRLHERGLDVALTIGPWTHSDTIRRGAGQITRDTLDWLAEHLAGTGTRTRPEPVHVYVTGANEWRWLPSWPPATTERTLFLSPGGTLSNEPADADAAPATFRYDPENPTPSIGGRLLSTAAGYKDDSVLAFTGPPLPAPLEVTGIPVAEIAHATDNPYADLFVRISEVDARGRSRNVSDGFVRLDPARPDGRVRLPLDPVAHRFAAGSRIRVLVAGGSLPHWDRNLGTAGDPATTAEMQSSQRTITLAGGASGVTLPVSCG